MKADKNSYTPQSIIIVGGEGTRLQPLTFKTPKPLLKVGNKTIVEYQFNKLKQADVNINVLATCYKAEMFKKHFNNGKKFNMHIKYAYEEQPLGTGGAIRHAYSLLPPAHEDTPIIIWNGDIISNIDLNKMLKSFYTKKADVMLYLTEVENPTAYGLVKTSPDGKIEAFTEKPKTKPTLYPSLINAGCYIMKRKVVQKFFPQTGAYSVERDIFPSLIQEGLKIVGHTTQDVWFDVGTVEKYLQANRLVAAEKINGLKFEKEHYSTTVSKNNINIIHTSATIHPSSTIINSMVEEGATVKENSVIENTYVGRNTIVETGCVIHGTIIGEGVYVGKFNEIPSGAKINNYAKISNTAIRFNSL